MKKYRELLELKGLLREKKINYETLAKYLKMSLSALSNKINGKSIFNILEVDKIASFVGIKKEEGTTIGFVCIEFLNKDNVNQEKVIKSLKNKK